MAKDTRPGHMKLTRLGPQHREVARLIASGKKTKEVCAELGLKKARVDYIRRQAVFRDHLIVLMDRRDDAVETSFIEKTLGDDGQVGPSGPARKILRQGEVPAARNLRDAVLAKKLKPSMDLLKALGHFSESKAPQFIINISAEKAKELSDATRRISLRPPAEVGRSRLVPSDGREAKLLNGGEAREATPANERLSPSA